jgi:hypothetical protein
MRFLKRLAILFVYGVAYGAAAVAGFLACVGILIWVM